MARRSFVSRLCWAARQVNDVSVLTSGNPHGIARWVTSTMLGCTLARGGIWRMLWGAGKR